jgi:hypothetical protein
MRELTFDIELLVRHGDIWEDGGLNVVQSDLQDYLSALLR